MHCPDHKRLIALLNEAQREEKKQRNEFNRYVAIGKDPELARRNKAISWRACVLMQASWGSPTKCAACELVRLFKSISPQKCGDVLLNCLPSSMVERFFRKEEVVSSSLADGSKILQEVNS